MERTVQIKAMYGDQVSTLSRLPTTADDLLRAVAQETKAFNFSVFFDGHPIRSNKDLAVAYLNNKSEELMFEVKENPNPMTQMDEGVQGMYQDMLNKFKDLSTAEKASEPLPLQNGVLSKENLLMVINELVDRAKAKLFESGKKFIEKRQELYGVDEENYKAVVMQQVQFQEMLIVSTSAEVNHYYQLGPGVFDNSINVHSQDPEIRKALENMSIEGIQASGEVPESLTKEKLKEVLEYSCEFITKYMEEHQNMNPMEVLVLKTREADEVMKKYSYDELEISAAMNKFDLENDSYFSEIRDRINQVTQKLFGYNPQSFQ